MERSPCRNPKGECLWHEPKHYYLAYEQAMERAGKITAQLKRTLPKSKHPNATDINGPQLEKLLADLLETKPIIAAAYDAMKAWRKQADSCCLTDAERQQDIDMWLRRK